MQMFETDPLMFIETATTKGKPSGRTIYDSRYDKDIKLETEIKEEVLKIDEETLSKLESIVELYQLSKPVLCDIKTIDSKYEGIPFEIKDEEVYIKHKGDILSLKVNTILEIIILAL